MSSRGDALWGEEMKKLPVWARNYIYTLELEHATLEAKIKAVQGLRVPIYKADLEEVINP